MIVLNVTYKCKPELREEFLEMIVTEGIDVASRAEAGNIKYDYYIPFEGGDDLLLVEKWQDAEAPYRHLIDGIGRAVEIQLRQWDGQGDDRG